MALLHIAGGVALMIFGIRFLRKGLERMFGHALHAWIEQMSSNRGRAAIAGLGFGSLAPSSTAQTLLTLQLLNAGKLPAERMLMFLLGANVGITVMVQLIAFRLFDYNALFLLTGVAAYLGARSETMRGAGQTLLALGFIFLAMGLISAAAGGLATNADFQTLMVMFSSHPYLLVVLAAGLTFATQSSTAVIGLVIALADAGTCTLSTVLPVVLGANLGLGLTSLVVGWATLAGKRLATANLVLKCAVIIPVLVLLPVVLEWIEAMPGGIPRQSANAHTTFNLLVAVLGAMLAGVVGRIVERAVRAAPKPTDIGTLTTHLDPTALISPVFALANATRETLRLTEEIKGMLNTSWRGWGGRDAALVQQVREHDNRVDERHAAIKHYLSQIPADQMTPRDSQLQFGLLHFASQLETIGDVIDKSFCHQILKQIADPLPFSEQDMADLSEMHRRTTQRLDLAILVLTTRDKAAARRFLRDGDDLKTWCIQAQRAHYQRLIGSDGRTLEASTRYLDLINALRRISGQLNTIGHTFAGEKPEKLAAPDVGQSD
ncbi:MAG: Na/Pi cotransporter family protein [Candidatus Didemnitutus sp.]|nr:Na/Pi cotransporter family protein [Candidatus Didemnitutus sp.]